jgi:hypothetical protein
VAEEVGLRIEIVGPAGWRQVISAEPDHGHFVVMAFAARWLDGEPVLSDELDGFSWLAPDLPDDLQVTEGLQDIIHSAWRLVGV